MRSLISLQMKNAIDCNGLFNILLNFSGVGVDLMTFEIFPSLRVAESIRVLPFTI